MDLRVASYNIQKGMGHDFRRKPDRTHQVIADLNVDILALQEADRRFLSRAGVLDLDRLKEECGLVPVPLPDRTGRAAHGWHGNLLLTRNTSIVGVRTVRLAGLEPRGAIIADLTHNERAVRIIAVHLGLLPSSRLLQARQLSSEVTDDDSTTILLGDFNEWRGGTATALAPLLSRFGPHASVPSFPAIRPIAALDRILVSGSQATVDLAIHDGPLARQSSDHLPVVARVRF